MVGVIDPGVYVDDGRGGRANIGIGEASDSKVVHLLNPLCRSVDSLCSEDLEVWVVAIVLDVAGGRSGEGLFVVQDFFLQTGEGVVERVDRLFVVFLSLFDRFGETLDDVGEESDGELSRIALEEVEGGLRGEWRALITGVVEHTDRVKERRIQRGTFRGVNGLEGCKDGSPSVVTRGLRRGVGGSDPKLNGERRRGFGGNKRGDRASCSGG